MAPVTSAPERLGGTKKKGHAQSRDQTNTRRLQGAFSNELEGLEARETWREGLGNPADPDVREQAVADAVVGARAFGLKLSRCGGM